MPNIQEGDLIAVPVAGAYQMSMASNYNGSRRPAAVMLENRTAQLIIKRETVEDLLRRQV
jgi:diaminopimelate decarboxylase